MFDKKAQNSEQHTCELSSIIRCLFSLSLELPKILHRTYKTSKLSKLMEEITISKGIQILGKKTCEKKQDQKNSMKIIMKLSNRHIIKES